MKRFAWTVGLVAIGFLVYNFWNSFPLFDLNFQDITVESLKQRFSEVNFVGGGNDFGGAILWLQAEKVWWTGITISYGSDTRTCQTRVRWVYYNNQRGMRLRPLDATTKGMLWQTDSKYNTNLTITWGFYRDCSPWDVYSVYGYIQYTLTNWSKSLTSSLAAGTKLNLAPNSILSWLAENFQFFNNTTPLGYIYDSNGGIWFVGWDLSWHNNLINFLNTSGNTISEGFTISWISIVSNTWSWTLWQISGINTAQDVLRNLTVQWLVGVSKSIDPQERLSLLGNPEKRTVILWWTEINSSTILNLAKKNAQNLCRGKTLYTVGSLKDISDTIVCIDAKENGGVLNIALDKDQVRYENKTIIFYGDSVNLTNTMDIGYWPFELYIDKWNLFIDNSPPYIWFNEDGFPGGTVTQWMYLKGNFIINGLIMWLDGWIIKPFGHKLHLEWKIVSLNSPKEPSAWRVSQVTSLFEWTTFNEWISLDKVFSWTCGFNGLWSDWTPCGSGNITSLVPFVILDGTFKWNLF